MTVPLIIGSKKMFAVDYDLRDPTSDEDRYWWFGHICFLVNGERVGNRAEETTMTTVRGAVPDILRYRDRRFDHGLLELPAGDAFLTIYNALSVDRGQSARGLVQARRNFERFDVIPIGVDVFDGWQAYLIEDERRGRYLWRGPDEVIREAWLKAGSVDHTLEAFMRDLNSRTGWTA